MQPFRSDCTFKSSLQTNPSASAFVPQCEREISQFLSFHFYFREKNIPLSILLFQSLFKLLLFDLFASRAYFGQSSSVIDLYIIEATLRAQLASGIASIAIFAKKIQTVSCKIDTFL